MCNYEENIQAGQPSWCSGMVVEHKEGVVYTLLANGAFYNHQTNRLVPIMWEDYDAHQRSYFRILA